MEEWTEKGGGRGMGGRGIDLEGVTENALNCLDWKVGRKRLS